MDIPARDGGEAKALEHLSQRLQARLALPAATVDAAISEALTGFAGRPVRDFVPILVERQVVDRLRGSRVEPGAPVAT